MPDGWMDVLNAFRNSFSFRLGLSNPELYMVSGMSGCVAFTFDALPNSWEIVARV